MLSPADEPLSCRKLGLPLDLSRDPFWRWRMIVLRHLRAKRSALVASLDENGETSRRESRKGSREGVRHERDRSKRKPIRRRRHEHPAGHPRQAFARAWSKPTLGVVDPTGQASFRHIPNTRRPAIEAALVPQVAPDAMPLFGGAPQSKVIAQARGMACEMLFTGRRRPPTPATCHLHGVKSLPARWKDDFRKRWRGPATKHLDSHTRWVAARRGADPLAMCRAIIA